MLSLDSVRFLEEAHQKGKSKTHAKGLERVVESVVRLPNLSVTRVSLLQRVNEPQVRDLLRRLMDDLEVPETSSAVNSWE